MFLELSIRSQIVFLARFFYFFQPITVQTSYTVHADDMDHIVWSIRYGQLWRVTG